MKKIGNNNSSDENDNNSNNNSNTRVSTTELKIEAVEKNFEESFMSWVVLKEATYCISLAFYPGMRDVFYL